MNNPNLGLLLIEKTTEGGRCINVLVRVVRKPPSDEGLAAAEQHTYPAICMLGPLNIIGTR